MERSLSAFEELRREMDRVFEGYERDAGRRQSAVWPRLWLNDRGEALQLTAELPGFTEKDVELSVERQSLTLRGTRKVDIPKGYAVHRQEREGLTFARTFALPCRVDATKCIATLKDGVLDVMLPKVPEEQPRQITVKAT
ncbi:MAG: Hsp20/alpha crystallin family protein [Polyangiaceae bacterium]|nr:Hsp20/alpha crystallin family protein [Polyangiaceae bacterium]